MGFFLRGLAEVKLQSKEILVLKNVFVEEFVGFLAGFSPLRRVGWDLWVEGVGTGASTL